MDAEWITSPTARRILMYWADSRPAWLWSHDGSTLLWHNRAARYFNAKVKKSGLKLAPEAIPIKGSVPRMIRLGTIGRSSLGRVQFLSGERPVAATCSCTPLAMPEDEVALLLVSVDAIPADVREAAGELVADALSAALFPTGTEFRLVEGGGGDVPDGIRIPAGPDGATLVIVGAAPAQPPTIAEVRAEEGVVADVGPDEDEPQDLADMPEPMLPLGLEPLPEAPPEPSHDHWVEPIPPAPERQLSSLFDRLAGDAELYSTLSAADDVFEGPPPELPSTIADEAPSSVPEEFALPLPSPEEEDLIGTVIAYSDEDDAPAPHAGEEITAPPEPLPPDDLPPLPVPPQRSHWMITGRGFRARLPDAPQDPTVEQPPVVERVPEVPAPPSPPASLVSERPPAMPEDASPAEAEGLLPAPAEEETTDRVTRYNFEELGRILTDRVAGDGKADAPPPPRPRTAEGVINLNAETLVLNRLPLAILVFRDQQVLFANRALTDLLGHESVESLRAAGIGSIFPPEGQTNSGPVNRLIRRDGTPLTVTARLQSVSWQGRAALMLSAGPPEASRGHEGAVRAFAEIAAEARNEGFLITDRAGVVRQLSGLGAAILGRPVDHVIGKPLAVLIGKQDMEPLRSFLEKPARFAETTRPHLTATAEDGEADLVLFAEGQAGVVTGYFGFLRKRTRVAQATTDEAEPGLLGRMSRGIRRPLNTIIGFADMIRSAAFGTIDTERYVEYARDIRTAGLEIAVLVDELDDFTRLKDGRYAPRPSDVDLQALLESCAVRVKSQAGAARVLVRSAISERLPRIHADRASLGQALLNLLASAIDQTPVGGSVILSAQSEDDGSIAIHVRDGAESAGDLAERFVVFRDGVDKDGEELTPVRSSVGLALTRSLLAVNACSLSVDPMAGVGTLFSMLIPAELVVKE